MKVSGAAALSAAGDSARNMIALSVNLNKIALIRNSRPGNYPDVCAHAHRCIMLGAQGITVHPRPDLRHIRPDDIYALSAVVRQYAQIEFNIEGNPFAPATSHYPGLMALVNQARPRQCTLVPDSAQQLTSDHGFDLSKDAARLQPIIHEIKRSGVRVSLFMDPDSEQIRRAADIGADRIELYTGPFAAAYMKARDANETKEIFQLHCEAANHAHRLGLGVNAGHDLNLHNLQMYRHLPHLQEVSIGHALTVDAIDAGLEQTIHNYLRLLKGT